MTLNDFLKRVSKEDLNKMIIFRDSRGWSNIKLEVNDNQIVIREDFSMPFEEHIIRSEENDT